MASDKRPPITLVCTETGDHNYVTTKNKTNTPDRLELMKYSPRLRKHTLHREKKIEKLEIYFILNIDGKYRKTKSLW
jgi:large subunit ribosomal protein L33